MKTPGNRRASTSRAWRSWRRLHRRAGNRRRRLDPRLLEIRDELTELALIDGGDHRSRVAGPLGDLETQRPRDQRFGPPERRLEHGVRYAPAVCPTSRTSRKPRVVTSATLTPRRCTMLGGHGGRAPRDRDDSSSPPDAASPRGHHRPGSPWRRSWSPLSDAGRVRKAQDRECASDIDADDQHVSGSSARCREEAARHVDDAGRGLLRCGPRTRIPGCRCAR